VRTLRTATVRDGARAQRRAARARSERLV